MREAVVESWITKKIIKFATDFPLDHLLSMTNGLSRLYLTPCLAALMTSLLLFAGCRRSTDGDVSLKSERIDSEISDSLKVGNIASVRRMIAEGKSQASDSDEYYAYVTNEAVADYYTAQPESLLRNCDRAMRYLLSVEETPDRLALLSRLCQTRAGYWQQYNFNADSALIYQKRGCEYSRRVGNHRQYIQSLSNLADSYRLRGDLDKSADTYRQAIMLADSVGLERTGYVTIYSGLAAVYTALHNFRQSDVWWRKTAELWPEMMENEKFFFLNNRGNDQYLKGDYEASLRTFLKLKSFLDTHPDMEWERHFCTANLSDIYIKLGRTQEAEPYIKDNLRYFSEVQPNTYAFNHVLIQEMNSLHASGRDDEVERLLASHPVDITMRPDQYTDRYEFLKDYYADTRQWREALDAERKFREMDDSLRNDRVALSAAEQELRYVRDRHVLSLQVDLDGHKRRLTQVYVWIAAAAAGFVILLLLFLLFRHRQRARETKMLSKITHLRFEGIRNRVTPHFIYNALNHELAARSSGLPGNLDALVGLIRRQQFMADQTTSPLEEEIQFADDYINVERANVRGSFLYEKEVDPAVVLKNYSLPSMTLQIFAENAFKHAFLQMPEEEVKFLRLTVEHSGGALTVSLFNNSPAGGDTLGKTTKVGLQVIMQTVGLLNSRNRAKMRVSVDPDARCDSFIGFRSSITIPDNFNYEI